LHAEDSFYEDLLEPLAPLSGPRIPESQPCPICGTVREEISEIRLFGTRRTGFVATMAPRSGETGVGHMDSGSSVVGAAWWAR